MMRGMKEEREMVGLKGLERFWGLEDKSSFIITAVEQSDSLHRNRKTKFYSKQRPTQDYSFFLLSFLQVGEDTINESLTNLQIINTAVS